MPGEKVEVVAQIRACIIAGGLVLACKHARGVVGAPDLHTVQDGATQGEYPLHIQEVGGFAGDLHS